MIAIILLPLYILINLYIWRWAIRYMKACHQIFDKKWIKILLGSLYILFAFSPLIGFLLPLSQWERFFKRVGNYWMGVLLYVVLVVVVADLIRILLRKTKWVSKKILDSRKTFILVGAFSVLLIGGVSLKGVYNAHHIVVTPYDIVVDKKVPGKKELKVVLVADLHLGYNIGLAQMEQMVTKINQQKPDLVCIAGDIFDNEYDAVEEPAKMTAIFRQIKSTYGVYACYGNHDVDEKILGGFTFGQAKKKVSDPRMDAFLKKGNIHLLKEESVLIDDAFYLAGRADLMKPGRGVRHRLTPKELVQKMDQRKPILVMDHEPKELDALAKAGVDVDLCGHTHDGQLFPGNIAIRFFWENPCGHLKKGQMHNIVTSGVGLFGPDMRVGTKAEICPITIHFQ